jgi:hypothetical protein
MSSGHVPKETSDNSEMTIAMSDCFVRRKIRQAKKSWIGIDIATWEDYSQNVNTSAMSVGLQ